MAMGSISARQMISANQRSFPKTMNPLHPPTPIQLLKFNRRIPCFSVRSYAKQSDFQDFQGYATPSRLLPAKEVKVCTGNSLEKILTSYTPGSLQSLYKVKLQTSSIYGSNLSDLNAGILLGLIDKNGDTILQRIPASLTTERCEESEEIVDPDMLHFQRNSVDEFTFEGPKLDTIEAVWISVESGQWRLGGVSLIVINMGQPTLKENDEKNQYISFQYDFEAEDILLGEGSNISMAELRPCFVTESSGASPVSLLSKSLNPSISPSSIRVSNEESMKDYADLKLSLLLYDTLLIFIGTAVTSLAAEENDAFAFLTGGVLGFLYLLLLQRSVDGLPAPALISVNRGIFDKLLEGIRIPILGASLALGFAVFAVKYGYGDALLVLAPKDIIIGMMGFLACKVAVVLAAFKPMPLGLRNNK